MIVSLPAATPDLSEQRKLAVLSSFGRRIFNLRRCLVAVVVVLGVLLIPRTTVLPDLGPLARQIVVMVGTFALLAGVALRIWASLYIGGHKNQTVVHQGPYGIVRNPLYLGNFLTVIGVVTLSGSLLLAGLALPVIAIVIWLTIASEEDNLDRKFGTAYAAYRAEVPRFVPRIRDIRRFLGDETPNLVSHRNFGRELGRGATAVGLGVLAFLLGNLSI